MNPPGGVTGIRREPSKIYETFLIKSVGCVIWSAKNRIHATLVYLISTVAALRNGWVASHNLVVAVIKP